MSPLITGMYHPRTNRLVVYDFGSNEVFVAQKRNALARGRADGGRIDQKHYVETVSRQASEFRTGANIGTTMHEVAHQLSFNSGMLNREGDVPVWLAEGIACYCEATENGAWLGIGEPNPHRLTPLCGALRGEGQLVHLYDLIGLDSWVRAENSKTILNGYAQSWALFHFLIKERPRGLAKYLPLIYSRRTADHRLTDFRQVFGADPKRFELLYLNYLKKMVRLDRKLEAARKRRKEKRKAQRLGALDIQPAVPTT
jgi:hypothetical protein